MSLKNIVAVGKTAARSGLFSTRKNLTVVPSKNFIVGPPDPRASQTEFAFMCGFITIGITAVPVWILFNLPNYDKMQK